jgi:response regulator RpfG family c-di-GMP phosphodiesterase
MKKILFVDDDPNILAGFQRHLRRQFAVEISTSPIAALETLKNWQDFAVVVADMRMPEMNGIEFLVKVKAMAPDLVRMMLTGNADQSTAMEAINEGCIFRFLNKPCAPEQLTTALTDGLRQYELVTAERDLLENTVSGSIKVLSEILATVEPRAFGHAEALRKDIRALAGFLNLGQTWQFEIAALLAGIGQVTLPPETALKARVGHALSPREQEMFQQLPTVGAHLVSNIPRLEEVSKIIQYQNKQFDGGGYPVDNVSGENIPAGARMLKALADLTQLEAKGAQRPAALEELRRRSGWYDPRMLEAISGCFKLAIPLPGEPAPPLAVTFSKLQVGHLLISDIQTRDGVMIVSAGNRITQPLLQRLKNFSALSGIKEPIQVAA